MRYRKVFIASAIILYLPALYSTFIVGPYEYIVSNVCIQCTAKLYAPYHTEWSMYVHVPVLAES